MAINHHTDIQHFVQFKLHTQFMQQFNVNWIALLWVSGLRFLLLCHCHILSHGLLYNNKSISF